MDYDLTESRQYFLVLHRSLGENVAYALNDYIDGGWTRILRSLLMVFPAMWFLTRALAQRVESRAFSVAVVVGFLPLGLILLADDIYRWYVLIVIDLAVLNLIPTTPAVARQSLRETRDGGIDTRLSWGVIAVLVAMSLPYPYFMSNNGTQIEAAMTWAWHSLMSW